jgi:hypothetical protein
MGTNVNVVLLLQEFYGTSPSLSATKIRQSEKNAAKAKGDEVFGIMNVKSIKFHDL